MWVAPPVPLWLLTCGLLGEKVRGIGYIIFCNFILGSQIALVVTPLELPGNKNQNNIHAHIFMWWQEACCRHWDYRAQKRFPLPWPLHCILMPVTGGPEGFRGPPVSGVARSTPPVLNSPLCLLQPFIPCLPLWDVSWGHTTVTEPHVQRKLVSFVSSCWMELLYF